MADKRISRRNFLRSTALAGSGLWLAACVAAPAPTAPTTGAETGAGAAAATGEVDYWHNFIAEVVHAGFEVVLDNFHEAYPDITINELTVPNADFMTKFATSVQGGGAPDTSMASPIRIPDMVAMGGLQDITEEVEESGLMETIPADRWDGGTVDGRIYGVPSFMFVDWMYYRADWFEEAGIDPPTTFEEFTEAAIALTDPDQGRFGFGMRGGAGGQGMVVQVIEAFGSPIIDEEGQPAMDFDRTVEALRWYTGLHTEHGAVPPSVVNDSFRQIMEAFRTGQTAMLWHHTGSFKEISTALGTDGVFMTQTRPEGSTGELIARATPSYNGLVSPEPENREAALAWINYWAELDTQVVFLEETGYFPTAGAVAEDERVAGNAYYDAAVNTVDRVGPPTRFPGSPGWEQTVVLPAFQRTLLGEITPEDAAELIIEGLEETISG